MPRNIVLLGGPSGAGKTFAYLQVVLHNPGARHFAIAADEGLPTLLHYEFPHVGYSILDYDAGARQWVSRVRTGDQLTVYRVTTFSAALAAITELEKAVQAKPPALMSSSWVCVDRIDMLYSQQQNAIVERASRAHRERKPSHLDDWDSALDQRAANKPMFEQQDWQLIKGYYWRFLSYILEQQPGNVLVTTGVEELYRESQYVSKEHKELAEEIGVQKHYSGQKETASRFPTLLCVRHVQAGYFLNVWKVWGGLGMPLAQHNPPILPRTDIPLDVGENNFWAVAKALFGWEEAHKD